MEPYLDMVRLGPGDWKRTLTTIHPQCLDRYWHNQHGILVRMILDAIAHKTRQNPTQSAGGMSLLKDTSKCGLRMRQECWERFPRHRLQRKLLVSYWCMHHGSCVMHVGIANPWRRGKRFRHSRRMCNTQFYISGKRPMPPWHWHSHFSFQNIIWISGLRHPHGIIGANPSNHTKEYSFKHRVCLVSLDNVPEWENQMNDHD